MPTSSKKLSSSQAGFSLVEILVGLAIGLLATMVIMQVFSVFEGQKRSTTGSADAQTNGSIALYTVTRDAQMAGYSLMPVADSPLECATLTFGATGIADIFPVTITDGGGGASDTVIIRYGDSPSGGIPTTITAMGAPTANDATVTTNFACRVGDVALIANGTTCAMTSVNAVAGATTVTLADITATGIGANLACLGSSWNEISYAVNNGNLERNGVTSMAGIVSLQAQYGISAAANSNQVTNWVDATGGTWAAPTIADRNRIKAVRIAVVARNSQLEKDVVTEACSSTSSAAPTGLCAWAGNAASPAPEIDLTADADWARYRYRAYETIIPLRNMIWAKDTL
jgi:type IV pilus assembly protein PilW